MSILLYSPLYHEFHIFHLKLIKVILVSMFSSNEISLLFVYLSFSHVFFFLSVVHITADSLFILCDSYTFYTIFFSLPPSPSSPSLQVAATSRPCHSWGSSLNACFAVVTLRLPLYGSVFIFLDAIPPYPPLPLPRPGILLFPLFPFFFSSAPTVFLGGSVEEDVMFVTRTKMYCRGECTSLQLLPSGHSFLLLLLLVFSSPLLFHHFVSSRLFAVLLFIVRL